MCDAPACSGIAAFGLNVSLFPVDVAEAKEIRKEIAEVGIRLELKLIPDPGQYFSMLADPKNHVPLRLFAGWGKDYMNASTYFVPLFAGDSIGSGSNYSIVGASPEQLQEWGYQVKEVPGIDDRINACLVRLGEDQLRCWADLDQYLMEDIVPWVPTLSVAHVQVIPSRIARYSYDQFADLPALDQIALQLAGS